MYISNVDIKNFRCFKDKELTFENGVNLIIGNNGAGKTSVLAAVSNVLECAVYIMGGGLSIRIENEDVNTDIIQNSESTYDVDFNFPVSITGRISGVNEPGFDVSIVQKEGVIASVSCNKDKQIVLGISNGMYPLISYQRFDREWKTPTSYKGGQVTIQTGLIKRTDGYKQCLSGQGIEDEIQQWCLKMSMMEFEKKGEIKEFRTFQEIIDKFMQIMEGENRNFKVRYSMKFSGLVYEDEQITAPLYELSTGYKALLSMIMELAYRSVILNPDISSDMNGLTGTVLIDEIDAHLHPKWQWKVLDALRSIFPDVQFIVATHSPIVISSANSARIIAIDKDGTLDYMDSAYGFSIGDVLALRQGSTDMPEASRQVLSKLETALDANDLQSAKAIVDEAQKTYGEGSAFYQEVKQYYDINSLVGD